MTEPRVEVSSEIVGQTRRARYALAVIAAAQLLVVLDASVVTIALPSAQLELGLADSSRQWVFTGYSLGFGGLLLLGGRVADVWGRRRTFLAGLVGFVVASVVGGMAVSGSMLIAARAAQGVSAAFLAPAGLAILSTVFPAGAARARAFAIFGAVTGSGGIVGVLLGGLLTSSVSWRWCLLINLPIGLAVLVLSIRLLDESVSDTPVGFDVAGAITVTLGSTGLVYGISAVSSHGWWSVHALGSMIAGASLLSAFVLIERRAKVPMMPLRLVADRIRGAAFAVILLANAAAYSFYLLLTFYLQDVLGYGASATGLAFVPVGVGIIGGSMAGVRLLARWQPRTVTMHGLALATVGMGLLGLVRPDVPFWALLLPAQVVLGVGFGIALTTVVNLALRNAPASHAGVVSGLTNAAREVGGAIGLTVLNGVAIAATAGRDGNQAAGYAVAFLIAAVLLLVGLLILLAAGLSGKRRS